jgi:hypothetical protein
MGDIRNIMSLSSYPELDLSFGTLQRCNATQNISTTLLVVFDTEYLTIT